MRLPLPAEAAAPRVPLVRMHAPLSATYDAAAITARFSSTVIRERAVRTVRELAGTVGPTLLELALRVDDGEDVWRRRAPHWRVSAERLGPTFIKLAQAAANRPDLVPVALAEEFRLLQDSAEPFDSAEARQIIEEDLGERAADVLQRMPSRPCAAASLGQVYRVELEPGRVCAIKVLRPAALEAVALDALLLRRAAQWVEGLRWEGKRLVRTECVAAVDEFFSRLFEETDYENELRNLSDFNALYGEGGSLAPSLRRGSGRGEILMPQPRPELCSKRVLTMSWVEGDPVLGRGRATLPQSELPLVTFGIQATLSQLLESGVMHADPHAGNLLRAPPRRRSRLRAMCASVGSALGARAAPPPPRLAYLDFGRAS